MVSPTLAPRKASSTFGRAPVLSTFAAGKSLDVDGALRGTIPCNNGKMDTMKIELKKVSYSERLSEETSAFVADVYIDGKKRGEARNDGHGGPTTIHPVDLEREIDAYAKTLPPEPNPWEKGGTIQPDAEILIDDALTDYLDRRDLKRALGRRTLFVRGGKLLEMKVKGVRPRDAEVVLNDLPFDEALRVFRAQMKITSERRWRHERGSRIRRPQGGGGGQALPPKVRAGFDCGFGLQGSAAGCEPDPRGEVDGGLVGDFPGQHDLEAFPRRGGVTVSASVEEDRLLNAIQRVAEYARDISDAAEEQDRVRVDGRWFCVVDPELMAETREALAEWTKASTALARLNSERHAIQVEARLMFQAIELDVSRRPDHFKGWDRRSFAGLHAFVDANEYLPPLRSGPYQGEVLVDESKDPKASQASIDRVNAIIAEVDRLLVLSATRYHPEDGGA